MPESRDILIVGAGLVGLCCALALQEHGHRVTLVDRDAPGEKASRWNAGVWATSSLIPLANPATARRLPSLLTGRAPGFRLDPRVLPSLPAWGARFLAASRPDAFARSAAALNALITASRQAHEAHLAQTSATHLRRAEGWLHLHRTRAALKAATHPAYETHDVTTETLDADALAAFEPSLARRYAGALHFPGSAAILEPAALVAAYLDRVRAAGATIRRSEVRALSRHDGTWHLTLPDGGMDAEHVVVAAGPWSAALLRTAKLNLPLLAERGTMRRFALPEGVALRRPVFDLASGLVLSPRPGGVQVSTGTVLTRPGAQGGPSLWPRAERDAPGILPLGKPLDEGPVTADRPTLPDCLPAIGPVRPGLWLCCGHQHVGFSTSAGSGALLARMMGGLPPDPALAPHLDAFAPTRFAGMS